MCYWFISKVKWGFHRASFRSGCFELLFCFNSAILISTMTLLLFNFFTIFSVTNLAMYWLRREICTSLQLQRSPLIEFWEAISMHEDSEFASNEMEKNDPNKYYSFLNCFCWNLPLGSLVLFTGSEIYIIHLLHLLKTCMNLNNT